VAIVVLVLWLITAGAGIRLLLAGASRRRAAGRQRPGVPAEALVRTGAVPLTAEGKPPPTPHATVRAEAGEHPLLEFSHPALAITGVACWLMFTLVHYRPFAWISVGVMAVTLALGLSWLARSRADERAGIEGSGGFPPRLIAVHGSAAGLSVVLAVLSALVAAGH
jgi:hypothetical protein